MDHAHGCIASPLSSFGLGNGSFFCSSATEGDTVISFPFSCCSATRFLGKLSVRHIGT
jgi:hypothetical protein